ncbi:MAG: O-antigen ligase family protein [Ignavibacteriaceae bacterium]
MDLVLLITFLSISYRFLSGEYRLELNSTLIGLLFFYLSCIIGVYWGIKSGHPAQDVFFDIRGFFYYILFIPIVLLFDDFKKLKYLFFFILFLGTLKCTIDTFMSIYILPTTFDSSTKLYLPFARLEGYNEVVYPITLIASLSFFYFTKNIKIKFLLIPTMFFSLTALFLSYARGSWLAALLAIVSGILFLIMAGKLRIRYFTLFLSLGIITSMFFILSVLDIIPFKYLFARATSISLNKIDISNLGRLVEYATAFSAFLRNPLLGAGLGFHFTYYTPGIGEQSTIYCHNSYLYVLSKLGILGFIPFVWMLISAIKIGYEVLKSNIDTEEIGVVFSFIMMLLTVAFKSFTTWHLNTVTFSMFIGVLLGVSILYRNKLRRKIIG